MAPAGKILTLQMTDPQIAPEMSLGHQNPPFHPWIHLRKLLIHNKEFHQLGDILKHWAMCQTAF